MAKKVRVRHFLAAAAVLLWTAEGAGRQTGTIRVDLAFAAPGSGPTPNFSPYGTQVPLQTVPATAPLPSGAVHPAKTGVLKVGPGESSWISVLATATRECPTDLCQLFVDRNRNGRFDDEGPGRAATPSQNEKTKAWWSSIDNVELQVPYPGGVVEPFVVSFWSVREDGASPPDVIRYSRRSWRIGRATVNGVDALVAAMDGNNDAIFTRSDSWSVVNADAPNAARAVLSSTEARPGARFMFLKKPDGREMVLEFKSFTPDGRSVEFAVVDRAMTKAEDRAPDDLVGDERGRARTKTPFRWSHDFNAAQASAKGSGRKLIIDFETTWCGPCKTMDEWIWSDADVAGLLNAGYVGVKLDGDVEKALVQRFKVGGYPTMIVLDPAGNEIKRVSGYQSSKSMLSFLR